MDGFVILAYRMHGTDSAMMALAVRNGFNADGKEFKAFLDRLQSE
jgi:hypothetical protein